MTLTDALLFSFVTGLVLFVVLGPPPSPEPETEIWTEQEIACADFVAMTPRAVEYEYGRDEWLRMCRAFIDLNPDTF